MSNTHSFIYRNMIWPWCSGLGVVDEQEEESKGEKRDRVTIK